MEHYICTGGCNGESNSPKICGVESCAKKDQDFSPCHCEDGLHMGAFDVDHTGGLDHEHSVPVEEPEEGIQ